MSDKNKPVPLPMPGFHRPIAELLKILREHPDVAHLNFILSDEVDDMEERHITHMNVPMRDVNKDDE